MPNWFRRAEETPHLPVVAACIRDHVRVDLAYASASKPKTRDHARLAPLGIVNKAGVWYLVAEASGATRVFRVARIQSVRVHDEKFVRPAGFDLAAFWERWSADFEGTRPRVRVVVRASPAAVRIMPEVFGDEARAALAAGAGPDAEGWTEVTLTFEHEAAAAHRLAGFGGTVEVRTPRAVRARLVEIAASTLTRYERARAGRR
jgi:predicted DNA-binding transcriptional regulator YafY